jgi:hypothetical protein
VSIKIKRDHPFDFRISDVLPDEQIISPNLLEKDSLDIHRFDAQVFYPHLV